MDEIGCSWLEKFRKDPEIKGAKPEAIELFAVKISNLIRKGHIVDHVRFYWTSGTQSGDRYHRSGKGPHFRAVMEIDGKDNRFWFYDSGWPPPQGRNGWQNTTKQQNSHKKWKEEWLGDQR